MERGRLVRRNTALLATSQCFIQMTVLATAVGVVLVAIALSRTTEPVPDRAAGRVRAPG